MAEARKQQAVQLEIPGTAPVTQMLESAPVIFFDGAQGAALTGTTVRFNLYQDLLTTDPSKQPPDQIAVTRVVCARLVMSVETAKSLRTWLDGFLNEVAQDAT